MTDFCSVDWCSQPPLSVEQFRTLFAAFADPATYPDAMIQTWLDLAPVDPCIWADRYQLGQGLWTAHELSKYGPNGFTANNPPGGIAGIVQSKSVGPVSVSYDTGIGIEDGAGQYNLTIYGRQFWAFAKMLAIGPFQIGAATPGPPGFGRAWSGPWPYPSSSGFSS